MDTVNKPSSSLPSLQAQKLTLPNVTKQWGVLLTTAVIIAFAIGSIAGYSLEKSKSQTVSPPQPTVSTIPEADTVLPTLPANIYADPTTSKILFSTVSANELVWNIFVNNHVGIKFIYPSNYAIPQLKGSQIRLLRGYDYMFEIRRIDTQKTLDQWKQDIQGYRISKRTFRNYQGYYFATNQAAQTPTDFYAVKISNSIYTIAFASGSHVQPPEKSILDKILNSVIFL